MDGTGLRAYRLGSGLARHGHNITIAIPASKLEGGGVVPNGIQMIGWGASDEEDRHLVARFDTVIMPMSMSGEPLRLASYLNNRQQLIVDAYSPAYIELLTRSKNPRHDKQVDGWYEGIIMACSKILVKADYILYAGENQKNFYYGVLSALGALHPGAIERLEGRLINIPGAVEDAKSNDGRNPYDSLGVGSRKVVLWFGALYPWYDISPIIELFSKKEIASEAALVVVGGFNPGYDKSDMRFNSQYLEAVSLAKKNGAEGKSIFFVDWVGYEDRLSWFRHATLALSVNGDGIENAFSWRVRVADLAGNLVPVLTNGGDQVGDMLLEEGAAVLLDIDNPGSSLRTALRKEVLEGCRKRLQDLSDELHIYQYAERLAKVISFGETPRINQDAPQKQSLVFSHIADLDLEKSSAESRYAELCDEHQSLIEKYHDLEEIHAKTLGSFTVRIYSSLKRRIANVFRR